MPRLNVQHSDGCQVLRACVAQLCPSPLLLRGRVLAVYRDVRAFQTALDVSSVTSRADFLYMVRWAKVEDTTPYPNTNSLKAMVFAMHIGLLPESHQCQTCRRAFRLSYRQGRAVWEWSQQSEQCAVCRRTRRSLTAGPSSRRSEARIGRASLTPPACGLCATPRRSLKGSLEFTRTNFLNGSSCGAQLWFSKPGFCKYGVLLFY